MMFYFMLNDEYKTNDENILQIMLFRFSNDLYTLKKCVFCTFKIKQAIKVMLSFWVK